MKKALLIFLLIGGFVSTAGAQQSDRVLFDRVSDQVNGYGQFTIFDSVYAQIEDGIVTLSGKVTHSYKSSEIEERVAKVNGVKEVRNEIGVLPASPFDDSLRAEIARALYAHPVISTYGLGPNPSIHVIVEHGRVTLEGVVNNDMDRKIAESIARSSLAYSVVNDLKTPDEVRQAIRQL
ncbi:MAG: BON domain-containing protein [Vicinamibacterales bacterium]